MKEEKIKSKSWITKQIRKFISIMDKLHKEMIDEKKLLTKTLKHESFKEYRNQIINLLTVSKKRMLCKQVLWGKDKKVRKK